MSYSRSHANRGKALQNLIDETNAAYASRGLASVQFVATPTKVLPGRGGPKIIRAKSTVDYAGTVAPGISVAFDAKQTGRKSWPLEEIEDHQVRFLHDQEACGAVAFLIVEFSALGRAFFLGFDALDDALARAALGGRKSISLAEFGTQGIEIYPGRGGVPLDYAPIVRQMHEGRQSA